MLAHPVPVRAQTLPNESSTITTTTTTTSTTIHSRVTSASASTSTSTGSGSSTCAVADDDGDNDDSRSVYSDRSDDEEATFAYYEDDTRDKYARLAARGRAAELAYNRKLEREQKERRERERSTSRSRSRPTTPLHSLFGRRDSGTGSRPNTPKSGLSLLKFVPISRSSSSKSISGSNSNSATTPGYTGYTASSGSSAAGSSVPSSPFASPKTPHSPLPFFLSTPKRRKSYAVPNPSSSGASSGVTSPRDEFPPLIEGVAGITLMGEPLTRTPRRASPPPSSNRGDVSTPATVRPGRRPSNSRYAHSFNGVEMVDGEGTSSMLFGSPLARMSRRPSPGRVHSLDS